MMQSKHPSRGVSLVELLVAMAILATALVPILGIFVQALKTSEHSNKRMIATNLARDLLEEIKSKPFLDPQVDVGPPNNLYPINSANPQPFGNDANDGTYNVNASRLLQFDDVDDYNNWCRGPACVCTAAMTADICRTDLPLEDYAGNKYQGAEYPHYQGFTRKVEVFNITPSAVRSHAMPIGVGEFRTRKTFNFYDYRTDRLNTLQDSAVPGLSKLKVIKVTVQYTGGMTPPITIVDMGLAVMPASRENL